MRATRAAQFGRYQFHSPMSFISAGTSSARMIVASIVIATARPQPNCLEPDQAAEHEARERGDHDRRRRRHDPAGAHRARA